MGANQDKNEVSRRGFLKVATITAVAATATGTGVALIKQANQSANTTITTAEAVTPVFTGPPIVANTAVTENFAQLAAVQADNLRLQAALDAANRQLASLQQHESNSLSANESVQVELASANERVSVLAGLVALYEQLEGVDLDTALANGMTAVSDSITGLLNDVPSLEESIATGTLALAGVETHLPVLANGRAWLDGHLGKLDGYFHQIEVLLMDAVEAVAPFLEMVNDWFAGVKKWLPFGMGETAVTIMQSITTLLIETPATVSGLNTNIAQPLDVWLARDDQNEIALSKMLVKPLRDDLMVKTTDALAKARGIETAYTANLKEPVATAVARQHSLRTLITDYRQQHQI